MKPKWFQEYFFGTFFGIKLAPSWLFQIVLVIFFIWFQASKKRFFFAKIHYKNGFKFLLLGYTWNYHFLSEFHWIWAIKRKRHSTLRSLRRFSLLFFSFFPFFFLIYFFWFSHLYFSLSFLISFIFCFFRLLFFVNITAFATKVNFNHVYIEILFKTNSRKDKISSKIRNWEYKEIPVKLNQR